MIAESSRRGWGLDRRSGISMSARGVARPALALVGALCVTWSLGLPAGWGAQASQTCQDPNLLAAEDYLRQNNYTKAVEAVELSISLEPRCDPEAYVMLATARLNLGEKKKAIEACEQGLDTYPKSARLQRYYVSLLRVAAGKEETKAKLEQCLTRQPNSAVYLKAFGELLMEENPTGQRAEELLAAAAKAAPSDAEAHYLYGKLACVNNNEELCIAELSKAHALAPGDYEAGMQIYTMIGIAEDNLNRPAEAEAAFQKALKFNEKLASPSPYAAFQYAVFLANRRRDVDAQRLVDDVLKSAPTYGPAHFERAKFLAKQRNMEQAATEAELALKYAGNDKTQLRTLHAFLAKTCSALGRLEEAKVHRDWVEAASTHFQRAKLLAEEDKMEEAAVEAEQALEYAGHDLNQLRAIHAFLVRTYSALGKGQDAKIHEDWLRSHL